MAFAERIMEDLFIVSWKIREWEGAGGKKEEREGGENSAMTAHTSTL